MGKMADGWHKTLQFMHIEKKPEDQAGGKGETLGEDIKDDLHKAEADVEGTGGQNQKA